MQIAKSSKARAGSPLKSVAGADGHQYYIVNAKGAAMLAPVTYVQYYSSLNQYEPNAVNGTGPTGFYWVRDAASTGEDHYGDPSVTAGWAMYLWDAKQYQVGVMNSGWVKIAQQGDVDWDITDELKAQFVLKTVFNTYVNTAERRFTIDEAIIKGLSAKIENHETRITILENRTYHTHDNKDTLDLLSHHYNMLYFNGQPIAGNSYIYDRVHDDEIWWKDPTDDTMEEVQVDSSWEIAQKFTDCPLARIGLSLFVVEVNGDISLYKYVRRYGTGSMTACGEQPVYDSTIDYYHLVTYAPGVKVYQIVGGPSYTEGIPDLNVYTDLEGVQRCNRDDLYFVDTGMYIEPKFAQTIVKGNYGVPEYVDILPVAAKAYVGRGCWVPLEDDGEHTIGHLHECIREGSVGSYTYRWVDRNGSTGTTTTVGGAFRACWADDVTMWKHNYLTWSDPADTTEGGIPLKWSKTTLVRKYGSEPIDINDGEVIKVSTTRDAYKDEPYEDVIPYTTKDVYYRLFSTSKLNVSYVASTSWKAAKLDWETLSDYLTLGYGTILFHVRSATTDASKVFIPCKNAEFEGIECDVVAINKDASGATRNGILLVANNAIIKAKIDNPELEYALSTDTVVDSAKIYYVRSGSIGSYTYTKITSWSSGQTPAGVGAYEHNPEWDTSATTPGSCGSNGKCDLQYTGSYSVKCQHPLTTNIMQWLNSQGAAGSWFEQKTIFDTVDSDFATRKAGFLSYISDEVIEYLRSISLTNITAAEGKIIIEPTYGDKPLRVGMPMITGSYWDNIPKTKTLIRTSEEVDWATLTSVVHSSTTTMRLFRGFKKGNNTDASVTPDTEIGIVPMFFIGSAT